MTSAQKRPLRIAVVTCYFDPDYVRGTVIHRALAATPDSRVRWVRSRAKGALRFLQIAVALLRERMRHAPDVWVVTFRGQEILPLVLLIAGRTPVVFDEFIVPLAYATQEPHRDTAAIRIKHTLAKLLHRPYSRWLRRCALIIADTQAHATLSAELNRVPKDRYRVLPVGADEERFAPSDAHPADTPDFTVLYYGNMLPLHGIGTVLDAAVELRDTPRIRVQIVGGGEETAAAVAEASARGASISHTTWIPLDELPATVHRSQLCLGGPFGGTPQAKRVVTGKTYQFLAAGVPALVGRNEADSRLIDRHNCLIVEQQDPHALAETIRWAAAHPRELSAIAQRGRGLYEEAFATARQSQLLGSWLGDLAPADPQDRTR